jgi:cytochrome c5
VAKRLKPVGDVAFADAGGAAEAGAAIGAAKAEPSTGAAAAGPKPGAAAGKADGKNIYESSCIACHGAGVAGAPKAGDKTAWAPRLKTGMDTLYASALKGKGAMPAKGGNGALADAEVKAAVDYLVNMVK